MELRDAQARISLAMPANDSNVYAFLDTGKLDSVGHQPGSFELLLSAPAQGNGDLPDGEQYAYSIRVGSTDTPELSTVLAANVIVQTGSDDVGASARTYRFRLPSNCPRFVGVEILSSLGTDNSSGVKATLEMLF